MNMSPERYEQVRDLFIEICELDELQRSAILDDRCAEDAELRSEVEALLAAESEQDALLRESRLGIMADVVQAVVEENGETIGTLGKYRLIRKIGAGGMGAVYEAEQDHPRRNVALKVVRPGLASAGMMRRFAHEAHVLGLLQHPGIAQIFDAGTAETAGGVQPYFVMELVRGRPLNVYAEQRNLSTRQRLELMAQVAEAVHHAHTKGVVHRDLKPGNILVVEENGPDGQAPGRAQPKILDFGVARATDSDVMTTTLHTDIGQLIGTVPYMSPEQASGDTDQIDTRSDVYSLGVVCYELLAQRLPHDLHHVKVHEAVRVIREEEPMRLSSINRAFRGDVETVIGKALEKDKERRYQSAADFAADIRRYLSDEPIVARAATRMYQARKFAQRNKALVGGVLSVFLVLLAGVATTTYWLLEAIEQRDKAERAEQTAKTRLQEMTVAREKAEIEAAKATAVRDFLTNTLASADPQNASGKDLSLREVLDQAAANIDGTLKNQPEVFAIVADTIGWTYHQLGEYEGAEPLLRAALQERRKVLGDNHRATIDSMARLSAVLRAGRESDEAGSLLEEALTICEQQFGPHDEFTLQSLSNLGSYRRAQSRYQEAERLLQQAVDGHRAANSTEKAEYLVALNNLGSLFHVLGRLKEAEPYLREVVERGRQVHGDEHRSTLTYEKNLGLLLRDIGQTEEAERHLRHVLEVRERTLPSGHPATLSARNSVVDVLLSRDLIIEARDLAESNLAAAKARLGEDHDLTLTLTSMFATTCARNGDFERAEKILRELVANRKRVSGDRNLSTLTAMNNLANALTRTNRHGEAADLLAEVRDVAAHVYPEKSWQHGQFAMNHGQCLFKLERYEEAEHAMLVGFERLKSELGLLHERTIIAINALVDVYNAWGRQDEAAKYRKLLPSDASQTERP